MTGQTYQIEFFGQFKNGQVSVVGEQKVKRFSSGQIDGPQQFHVGVPHFHHFGARIKKDVDDTLALFASKPFGAGELAEPAGLLADASLAHLFLPELLALVQQFFLLLVEHNEDNNGHHCATKFYLNKYTLIY